ncbi:MAG: hypothetical protein COV70_01345 [Parcubacteria group bacterium CG11_big_fil_rev_8_21_14_0_20_39_22]|nr:MAG: hypothetical protein COV70_01345 [Parcubacteria group bacterium CG11_big_fil_rev_8_21_14_0_20_39_22]
MEKIEFESKKLPDDNSLEDLRDEVEELKRKEDDGEVTSGHFMDINVDDLTEGDLGLYDKLKREELTSDEINEYLENNDLNESGKNFIAFLKNKLAIQVGRRELEEMMAQREK